MRISSWKRIESALNGSGIRESMEPIQGFSNSNWLFFGLVFLSQLLLFFIYLFLLVSKKALTAAESGFSRLAAGSEIIFLVVFAIVAKRAKPSKLEQKILHVSLSQLDADIRIEKYVQSLRRANFQTEVLGADLNSTKKQEYTKHGAKYEVVPCRVRPFCTFWRLEHCRAAIAANAAVIHAHDLTSLLPAIIASKVTGSRVIYDAHEIWSQNVDYSPIRKRYERFSLAKRAALTLFELLLSKKADLFITVNTPIAEYYKSHFFLNRVPTVIRNVPLLDSVAQSKPRNLKMELGLPEETFLLGYIGGVGPSRNIESVIQAMAYLKGANIALFIMGPNLRLFAAEYRDLAISNGVSNQVYLQDGVRMEEVPPYIAAIDGGIIMLKNLCLNFYLFLPNKIFEYMAAKVPVLASNFPVVREIILSNQIGYTFDPESPEDIALAIKKLAETPASTRLEMGKRAHTLIFKEMNWETEVDKYLKKIISFLQAHQAGSIIDSADSNFEYKTINNDTTKPSQQSFHKPF